MHEPNPIDIAAKASGEPVFREIGVASWEEEHPGEPRPDNPNAEAYDSRYDTELLNEGDRRNVLDKYRYWSVQAIKEDLDKKGRHGFDVAVENWTHDFNIGSMVRTANAFAAHAVYIVGPHKWNRKGSLMTELYQHVYNSPSIQDLVNQWREENPGAKVIALDIVDGAVPIEQYTFPERCLMLFGAEGPGLSQKALELADDVVYISQFGSVRSINAGAAAAVAMHCYVAQNL
ncbi:MAG: TrmH family RNA methyltransferase [Bifidobacteriaceae bacterium]|nr:TrmH family RNA methyltransferase [Bifidobacteriaceae bacterium]